MPILLYLLAVAVFAQGTSEFVLAGLLSGISADLGVPIPQAGLLSSAFAIGMVVGAPPMAILGRRLPPRWTLSGFLALFIVMHLAGALTDSFAVLFATRIVAALANAGFLAVTLSIVVELVPSRLRARALAVVLGGTTMALIVGVPAGALLGSVSGWRTALWAIAVVSLPALIAVLVAMPTRPSGTESTQRPGKLGIELSALRRPSLQVTLLLAVLVNGATFCTFTYLVPLATHHAGIDETLVPLVLALFGVGAFIGVSTAGRLADRHWRRILVVGGPCLLAGWFLLAVTAENPFAQWVLVPALGALSFALGGTLIARIMAAAYDAPTMGGSFATVALNLGAIVGPVLGSLAFEMFDTEGPLFTSAGLVLVALIVWLTEVVVTRPAAAGRRRGLER